MSPTLIKRYAGVHKAVNLIGSKWMLLILYNLCTTPKGFNELMRLIDGISPKVLSMRLKELMAHGLITKTVFPTNPPTVEYRITEKGVALKDIIHSLGDWADTI